MNRNDSNFHTMLDKRVSVMMKMKKDGEHQRVIFYGFLRGWDDDFIMLELTSAEGSTDALRPMLIAKDQIVSVLARQ